MNKIVKIKIDVTHFFVSLGGFLLGSIFLFLSLRIGHMFPFGGLTGLCIGYMLCGMIGGGIMGSGVGKRTSVVRGAVGFGVGFVVPSFVIPVTMMAAGEVGMYKIFYIFFAPGIAFFIAGAVGTSMIKMPGLEGLNKKIVLGGCIFGIGGILGGFLSFLFQSENTAITYMVYFSGPAFSGGILGGVLRRLRIHSAQEKPSSLNVRKVLQHTVVGVMIIVLGVGFYLLPGYQEKWRINQLVSSRVDINKPPGTTTFNGIEIAENAPLHNEVIMGRIEGVRELIKAGADVNLERTDGFTALHLAALNNREEIAKLLIIEGADVKAKTSRGATPLHIAVSWSHNNPNLTKLLIDAGSDVNARDETSLTPLKYAVSRKNNKVTDILRSHGARE